MTQSYPTKMITSEIEKKIQPIKDEPKVKETSPTLIFILWSFLVIILNITSPFANGAPISIINKITGDSKWPPEQLMKGNVDNYNRAVVSLVRITEIAMADNFLFSLERNNVKNFVVVPLDKESYDALSSIYPGHVLPPMRVSEGDISADKSNVPLAHGIVQSRQKILQAFLKAGYTVFYNDLDSVWKSNAFIHIDNALEQAKSFYSKTPNNEKKDIHLPPQDFDAVFMDDTRPNNEKQYSAAQMYLLPTEVSIMFLEKWSDQVNNMVVGDYRQALQLMIRPLKLDESTDSTNTWMTLRFINNPHYLYSDDKLKKVNVQGSADTVPNDELENNRVHDMNILLGDVYKFPPGWMYFSSARKNFIEKSFDKSQREHVIIVHNNFERMYDRKIKLFQQNELWHPSGRLPPEFTFH